MCVCVCVCLLKRCISMLQAALPSGEYAVALPGGEPIAPFKNPIKCAVTLNRPHCPKPETQQAHEKRAEVEQSVFGGRHGLTCIFYFFLAFTPLAFTIVFQFLFFSSQSPRDCVCIYTHVCMCMCFCMCMCTCAYVGKGECLHTCIYVCIRIFVYRCVCVYIYQCVYLYLLILCAYGWL